MFKVCRKLQHEYLSSFKQCPTCLKIAKQNWALKNQKHKKQYLKTWNVENKSHVQAQVKAYRQAHPEKVKLRAKHYYAKRREKINEYKKLKRKTDVNYRLAYYLRNRLNWALKKAVKGGSAVKDLGCTVSELKQHLESKFQSGMSWENHGKWHIDHIVPISSADLSNRDELLKVCHYTNLQPLWAADNIRKGAK